MTSIPFYIVLVLLLSSFASALFNKNNPSLMADTKKTKSSFHRTTPKPSSFGLLSSSSAPLSPFLQPILTHTTDFYLTPNAHQFACGPQDILETQIRDNLNMQFELTDRIYQFFRENKDKSYKNTQALDETLQNLYPLDSSAVFRSDVIEEMIKLIDTLKRKELHSNPALSQLTTKEKQLHFKSLLSIPSYLRYFEQTYVEDQIYLDQFIDFNTRSKLNSMLKFNPQFPRHRIQVRSLKKMLAASLITKEHQLPNTMLTLPTFNEWDDMTSMQQVFYLPTLYYHLQTMIFDSKLLNYWANFCELQKTDQVTKSASSTAQKRKVH